MEKDGRLPGRKRGRQDARGGIFPAHEKEDVQVPGRKGGIKSFADSQADVQSRNETVGRIAGCILNLEIFNPFSPQREIIRMADLLSVLPCRTERELVRILAGFGMEFSGSEDYSREDIANIIEHSLDTRDYVFSLAVGDRKELFADERIREDLYRNLEPLEPRGELRDMLAILRDGNPAVTLTGKLRDSLTARLTDLGYKVIVPESAAHELWVEEKFFSGEGLTFIEAEGHPGYGILTVDVRRHPVERIIRDKIAPTVALAEGFDYAATRSILNASFFSINVSDMLKAFWAALRRIQKLAKEYLKNLTEEGCRLPEYLTHLRFVEMAADVTPDAVLEFVDRCASAVVNVTDALSPLPIPWLAAGMTLLLSARINLRRVQNKEIGWTDALLNIGGATLNKVLPVSLAVFLSGRVFSALDLNPGQAAADIMLEMSSGFSSARTVPELGKDFGILTLIIFIIRKIWRAIRGDPLKKYDRLIEKKDDILRKILHIIRENRERILSGDAPGLYAEQYRKAVRSLEICRAKKQSLAAEVNNLLYYVNEHILACSEAECALYGLSRRCCDSLFERISLTDRCDREIETHGTQKAKEIYQMLDARYHFKGFRILSAFCAAKSSGELFRLVDRLRLADIEGNLPSLRKLPFNDLETLCSEADNAKREIAGERDILVRKGHLKPLPRAG